MVTNPVGQQVFSLEDYRQNPPDRMEWVNGKLVEKNGMTFKHSVTQSRLDYYWRSYKISSEQGGEVLTEAARICPMSDGRGEFVIDKKRRSTRLDYCTPIHRKDGCSYAF
ncbi:hypothetical protein [Coleofasciculus sp. F4-SAH-05]|uniref:hypothetical protein n=1 Tax=Coleofasciculus sp. F4-SAH-05 TaxID=3069525 RepID=UPI0040643455